MKQLLLLLTLAALPGCLMEMLTVTAIQGELAAQNASSANRALSNAKDSKGKTEIVHAMKVYAAEKGHNPATLQELVPTYLPAIPMQSNGQPFGYDPATGEIYTGTRRAAPLGAAVPIMTEGDQQNVEYLRNMVYQYWQTTGRYPDSLNVLVPGYVSTLPMMSNGQSFSYNGQTGMVFHPAEMVPPPVTGQGSPVQSTPVGTDPSGIAGEHSQRQLQVMNQLGL